MRVEPTAPVRSLPTGTPRPEPRARRAAASSTYGRLDALDALDGDVEVSVRVFAEGGSVTVMRRTELAPDGFTRRTVGIEAVIR